MIQKSRLKAGRVHGALSLAAFILSIWLANFFVTNVGTNVVEGIHVLPVWFGLSAPSGFVWIGAFRTFRDICQQTLGLRWIIVGILVGGLISATLNSRLAAASGFTFVVAETLDLLVYTPLAERNVVTASVISNVVGSITDSALFLFLAFGSGVVGRFVLANSLGKLEASLPLIAILWILRRRGTSARPAQTQVS